MLLSRSSFYMLLGFLTFLAFGVWFFVLDWRLGLLYVLSWFVIGWYLTYQQGKELKIE